MQIVGYDTGAGDGREPSLAVADGDEVSTVPLAPGEELAYALGERRCAGVVGPDGHEPCDRPGAPRCDVHAETWVCARCTGTCLKDEMDCFDDHAVYLAAFAPDAFKVGVTKEWRLRTRLREQGADCAAHVYTVTNGRIARELEAEIASDVPDRVRVPEKIRGLHEAVDGEAWSALLDGFDVMEMFAFDYGLDLDARPVVETLAAGTVRGTKGRVLVLDRAGSTYAVDLRSLVGHELVAGPPDRDVQSSLGSFGDSARPSS